MVTFSFLTVKTNSCSVLTAYRLLLKKRTDYEGCILIHDVSINDSKYILINDTTLTQ